MNFLPVSSRHVSAGRRKSRLGNTTQGLFNGQPVGNNRLSDAEASRRILPGPVLAGLGESR